jgi:hypothetical protein
MFKKIVQPIATGTALPRMIIIALRSLEVAISVMIASYCRDFEAILSEQPTSNSIMRTTSYILQC